MSDYDELVGRIRALAPLVLPADASVLVVSGGDEDLLELPVRRAEQFPRPSQDGSVELPPDGAAAVALLEESRRAQFDFLIVPATSLWWLEHYAELREHLVDRYDVLLYASDTCVVYSLHRLPEDPESLVLLGGSAGTRGSLAARRRRDRRDHDHIRLLLAFHLAADSNCVDVGSNDGEILRHIVRAAPEGRHIAFEPVAELAEQLAAEFPQVDVRAVALANEAGEASFAYVRELPAYSGLRERSYPREVQVESRTVPVARLDEALPPGYVPSLVKIDVEGAEYQVLQGARRTLVAHRPVVVFEHELGGATHYGSTTDQIFRLLCDDAGLRLFDIEGNGPLDLQAYRESFERGEVWNYVALP
jgi:FkbM family methyltransferase